MEYEIGKTYYASDGKPYVFKGGDPGDRANWQSAASPAPASGEPRPRSRIASIVEEALSPRAHVDAAKTWIQGLTMGGGDEMRAAIRAVPALMPGGESPREAFTRAHAEENADIQRIHQENPRAAPLVQAAGGLLPAAVPLAAGATAVRAGGGILNAAARGAGAGALEGGIFGALSADGGIQERAAASVAPAMFGAAAGGLLGVAPAAANAFRRGEAGRGARVAGAMQDAAGVKVNPNATIRESEDAVRAVRAQHYGPLEAAHSAIDDPAVIDILRSEGVRPHTSAIAREVARDTGRPPSFEEAQKVLRRLRRLNGPEKKFAEEIASLDEAITNAVPGYADADAAFKAAVSPMQSMAQGRKFWNKSASDIERAQSRLKGEDLKQFRHGRLVETVRRLQERDEEAGAVLGRMMDAGPETEGMLRTFFPTDDAYEEFRGVLQRERSAAKVAGAFQKLGGRVGTAIGAAAAGGLGVYGASKAGLLD